MIDFLIHLYGLLSKRGRLLSPLRWVVRSFANRVIPYLLKNESLPPIQWDAVERKKKIIVTLTSFPDRIDSVWIVIKCLLRQTVRPDKVVLWLSEDQFPDRVLPASLTSIENDVFEIRFVPHDIRSHKKYYYAFSEFANDLVITADDDLFYESTMIQDMYEAYLKHPDYVICRYGSLIGFDDKGDIKPFSEWWDEINRPVESPDFFFGSGGGVIFQPNKLQEITLDISLARQITPYADDIWLNAMVRMANLDIYKVKSGLLLQVVRQQKSALKYQNFDGGNDAQFSKLIAYFKDNYDKNPFERRDK